jgi:hypothetical protein
VAGNDQGTIDCNHSNMVSAGVFDVVGLFHIHGCCLMDPFLMVTYVEGEGG